MPIPPKKNDLRRLKTVMHTGIHIFHSKEKNDEKILSQISKSEYMEIKSTWKEAK